MPLTPPGPAPSSGGAIGVFDSGFGGLTVLQALRERLPRHDYLYLGDSARVPYGNRSHEVVYEFTREAVFDLFARGCPLVVLACNTASARALRKIQQIDLPARAPDRRVLGVVRPSAEALAGLPPGAIPGVTPPAWVKGTVAVLGTLGTIASNSYQLELAKLAPDLHLVQQACPLWVPLVEAGETTGAGAEYFCVSISSHCLLQVCRTHRVSCSGARITRFCSRGFVLTCLWAWSSCHKELSSPIDSLIGSFGILKMEARLSRSGSYQVLTTDKPAWFGAFGERVLGEAFEATEVRLRPFS